MLAKNLLSLRDGAMPVHEVEEITDKLTSQLFYHGHPISRQEARDTIGLTFVEDAPDGVAGAMWNLFEDYNVDMKLDRPYQPILEAIAKNGPIDMPTPMNMNQPVLLQEGQPAVLGTAVDVPLDTMKAAYVESTARCDVFELDVTVTLRRTTAGAYAGLAGQMRLEWTTE